MPVPILQRASELNLKVPRIGDSGSPAQRCGAADQHFGQRFKPGPVRSSPPVRDEPISGTKNGHHSCMDPRKLDYTTTSPPVTY